MQLFKDVQNGEVNFSIIKQMTQPGMGIQPIQPVLELFLYLGEGRILQFEQFFHFLISVPRLQQLGEDVCEVYRLAYLIVQNFNLRLVVNVSQMLLLVFHIKWMWSATSVSDQLAVLDRREGVLVAVELVVNAVVKVVTLVCLHDNWKVIPVPVVGPWYQSEQ